MANTKTEELDNTSCNIALDPIGELVTVGFEVCV